MVTSIASATTKRIALMWRIGVWICFLAMCGWIYFVVMAFLGGLGWWPQKVVCSGAREVATVPIKGHLVRLDGSVVGDPNERGNEGALLYLLILCPDADDCSFTEFAWGWRYTTWAVYVKAATNWMKVAIDLDRWRDAVRIRGRHYSRAAGEAFLVVVRRSGGTEVVQMRGPGPHASAAMVLEHIKTIANTNAIVANLRVSSMW